MHPRSNILGVHVSAINMLQALETIESWIAQRDPHYVCITPAHMIMDSYWNPELRKITNQSGLTTPDGMAIVWLLNLKGYHHVNRVYGPDLMLQLCKLSVSRKWRHFFYGGIPGVDTLLIERLQKQNPGLQVAGSYSPPFRPLTESEDRDVIDQINGKKPDIVWIGISSPKQEQWMADHIGKLSAPVLIGVGAAFDFLSGRKKQAPRWIQRFGMEWLFRLATEPKRLWKRYAQYPLFGFLVLMQSLGITRYD